MPPILSGAPGGALLAFIGPFGVAPDQPAGEGECCDGVLIPGVAIGLLPAAAAVAASTIVLAGVHLLEISLDGCVAWIFRPKSIPMRRGCGKEWILFRRFRSVPSCAVPPIRS